MKNIAMIIANKGFQDEEFINPYELFLHKKYQVDIYSGQGWECFGVFGTYISDSLNFTEIDSKKYDAIIFIGWGWAYKEYNNNEDYLNLVNKTQHILAAICIAPSILSESWIFQGKEITWRDDGIWTEINRMKKYGAIYIPQDIVRDENIITASGPQAAMAFGHTIIEALEEK